MISLIPTLQAPVVVPMTQRSKLLIRFIDDGCQGICARVDDKLGGYAWIQTSGVYSFGRSGRLTIPKQMAFAKNLMVKPDFRGRKIGQKLNVARLALMPSDYIPIVFIIPENRYAIRNWKKYGFKRMVLVRRFCWFSGEWHMRITRLSNNDVTDVLVKALEAGSFR